MDHDVIADDLTLDGGAFADRQLMRADIAFDIALDLDIALGADIARDRQVR